MNFKQSFLHLIKRNSPIIQLGELPFWKQCTEASNETLSNNDCYVLNNYFYGFHSSVPQHHILLDEELAAKKLLAKYIIIPNVRDTESTKILSENNYRKIPASTEAIVSIGVDIEDIFVRTCRKYYRENMRYSRLSEQNYYSKDYFNEKINDTIIEHLASLHQKHDIKYRNKINIFNEPVIREIIKNRGSSNVRAALRYDKTTNHVVQASLFVEYFEDKVIHYQTQAIDKETVPNNFNLYRSSFMDVYFYALENGFKQVNLGRGLTQYKKKYLGADLFYEQSHWIKEI